MKITYTKIKLA